jgi:hypothetical protein
VLDWFIVQGEDALCRDARYPVGTATVTNYHGAGPAAEFEVRRVTFACLPRLRQCVTSVESRMFRSRLGIHGERAETYHVR